MGHRKLSHSLATLLVNIREFYTDSSGTQRPGKKGIALLDAFFHLLMESVPKIEAHIKGIPLTFIILEDERPILILLPLSPGKTRRCGRP